jgi:hypothetical protein
MDKSRNDRLPFEASGRIPFNLSTYDLTIDVSGNGGQEFYDDAESLVTCVVDAGEAGMLPDEGIPPQASAMELLSRKTIAEDRIQFVCRARNIHLSAYRMLLNMFAQLHQLSQPWRRVHMDYSPEAAESIRLDDPRIGQVNFLRRWSPLPFKLALEEFGSQVDMHTVRIEFAKRLEPAHFDIVGAALENWALLIMFGAYRDTFEVMEDFSITPGEIYMVDPYTVEQTIRAFRAPDIVFEGVINFAVKLHFTLLSVANLEIV